MSGHWEDLSLEVALKDAPRTLVDYEGRLVSHAGVLVRLRDYPRRRVRYTLLYLVLSRRFQ